MRAQPDQRRGFGKLLQHRPGVFIKTDSDDREGLVRGETLSWRTVDRISDGHRIHFVLGPDELLGLLPTGCVFAGRSLSKAGLFKNLIGFAGGTCAGRSARTGSTTRGVTSTTNSLLLRVSIRERNSLPRIGMSAIPGTLLSCAVARLSSKPAMPKD